MTAPSDITLRTTLKPGDIGTIVRMHGVIYAAEHNFDHTFEAYVAGPLSAYALSPKPRERLWIAELDDTIVGSIAIIEADPHTALLRWFLVAPQARSRGLGTRLLREAVEFARASNYHAIHLWTVSALHAAARLYTQAGFQRVEHHDRDLWGTRVTEEKYALSLDARPLP